MAATLVKLENVTFRYPKSGTEALSCVDLEIPRGSFFALLGPNGAGKTTLMRLLCGRLGAFGGSVTINGAPGFLKASDYGVLLENPGVYPKLSIEEYLSYFACFYGMGEGACMPGGHARVRVEELAGRLNLPTLSSRMSTLSLGNRQKVQILRALIHSPKILILDEPVANLDPGARETVWKLIAEWRERECGTAIVCSHILAEMESEATDYAIIDGGRILKKGKVESVAFGNSVVQNASRKFALSMDSQVLPEQVMQALKNAGLVPTAVEACAESLSDIYRAAINSSN